MYRIKINEENTTAIFKEKELAELFVNMYTNWHKKKKNEIERSIEAVFDEYELNYYSYRHKDIFEYLIDTDYIEESDIEKYIELKNELDNFKEIKISIIS